MRVFIEVRSRRTPEPSAETVVEEIVRIRRLLVRQQGWERVAGNDFDDLVNAMASRLPPSDLFGFAKNVRDGLRLMSPEASLTIGAFSDEEHVVVRLRLMAENDAVIVQLGEEVADILLDGLTDYTLSALKLWRDRKHEDLLQGRVEQTPPLAFATAWRQNPQFYVPLTFALLLLILGAPLSTWLYQASMAGTPSGLTWLGDPIWVWYGRLVGPLLMAVVTTLAAIVSMVRKPGRREARWRLSRPEREGEGRYSYWGE